MNILRKVFRAIWKGIKSFVWFWQDFLVGDSPEIAVGVIIILGIAFGLHKSALASAIVIPVAVILLLSFSLLRGRRKAN